MSNPQSVRYSRLGVRPLHAVVLGLVVALGVPLQGTSWAQPVGAEFQVNTYTTSNQTLPAVAADADGDFVVVWESNGPDGNFAGIFGQRYTSAGAAAGAEFQVNTYTTDFQVDPAVAADADGNFVVVWASYQDGSYNGIFGQRYTSAGAAVGAEFQVNTYTTSKQDYPAVAADSDGDFVVVWQSRLQDGSYWGVFGQRYTSAGAAAGAEFQVNTYTTSYQYTPAVSADADGNFVVVWSSRNQDGSGYGIVGRRYTSAGAAIGGEFQVNTYTLSNQTYPAVAADADGDFVVLWDSDFNQDGSLRGVFGQRYTSAGAAAGGEFQVNTYTPANERFPAVSADADGNFVAVWESSFFQDGNSSGVFGQRYTSAGAAIGTEFQVNTYTTSAQTFPAVAADADGDFVVGWMSNGQDGSLLGVFGQRFQPITATTTTSTTVTTSTTTTSTTTTTTTSTTLPPAIPTMSGTAQLLLAALLAFAMLVLGLAWRLNSRAG